MDMGAGVEESASVDTGRGMNKDTDVGVGTGVDKAAGVHDCTCAKAQVWTWAQEWVWVQVWTKVQVWSWAQAWVWTGGGLIVYGNQVDCGGSDVRAAAVGRRGGQGGC